VRRQFGGARVPALDRADDPVGVPGLDRAIGQLRLREIEEIIHRYTHDAPGLSLVLDLDAERVGQVELGVIHARADLRRGTPKVSQLGIYLDLVPYNGLL